MFQRKVVETIKTHILCSTSLFYENHAFLRLCGKYLSEPDRPQMTIDMTHMLCMLNNLCYRPTLRICNTWCFSMATVVTQMHVSVTFHISLPVLLNTLC